MVKVQQKVHFPASLEVQLDSVTSSNQQAESRHEVRLQTEVGIAYSPATLGIMLSRQCGFKMEKRGQSKLN